MADFNKPNRDQEYVNALPDTRDNQEALAKMFNGVSVLNIPVNSVQFAGGQFNLWDGGNWNVQAIGISGGGTGATTAAGARTNLGVISETDGDAKYLKQASNLADIDDPEVARSSLSVPSLSESALNADNLSNLDNAFLASQNLGFFSINQISGGTGSSIGAPSGWSTSRTSTGIYVITPTAGYFANFVGISQVGSAPVKAFGSYIIGAGGVITVRFEDGSGTLVDVTFSLMTISQ